MNPKPAKTDVTIQDELDADFREPTEADWAAVDAWEERNRDALIESIRQGRENFAKGNYSTLEDVMARVRARLLDDKN